MSPIFTSENFKLLIFSRIFFCNIRQSWWLFFQIKTIEFKLLKYFKKLLTSILFWHWHWINSGTQNCEKTKNCNKIFHLLKLFWWMKVKYLVLLYKILINFYFFIKKWKIKIDKVLNVSYGLIRISFYWEYLIDKTH
jgi:hypothetical protein